MRIIYFEDRLRELFAHLGIERAHIMGGGYYSPSGDVAIQAPELTASMTLVCPVSVPQTIAGDVTLPFVIFTGDGEGAMNAVANALHGSGHARHVILKDCAPKLWDDLARERTHELGDGILNFLASVDQETPLQEVHLEEGGGLVADLAYRVMGDGPPLVLFPFGLAPSQWDPLLGELCARYSVILVSGAYVPPSSSHERRIRTPGYMKIINSLLDAVEIEPGASILEVGCGTGAVGRVLAEYTGGKNPITGLDINAFLRREAEMLGQAAGFADIIDVIEGDAHALPVTDGAYDITLSVTMLEEVDAERAIAELVRVTRPGGRVGVIVRALDIAPLVSAELSETVAAGVLSGLRSIGAAQQGCADASLYRHLAGAGLKDLKMYPAFNTTAHFVPVQIANARSRLDTEQRTAFDAAMTEAGEGFFIGMPMHVAVGRKT